MSQDMSRNILVNFMYILNKWRVSLLLFYYYVLKEEYVPLNQGINAIYSLFLKIYT